jgi:hypothetical protein
MMAAQNRLRRESASNCASWATTTLNKRSQHHGLVDVRHPHPMLDEVAERGEDQVCHAIAGFISGRSKPHASIRGSCHSILATSKSFNLPRGEL